MNIKVSIPVEQGGYTGQREQWEQRTGDYYVDIEDDERIVLESTHPVGSKIWIDLDELTKAVEFVRSREGGQQ
jgi:hypothetical protein